MTKQVIFTGLRASNDLHIGNYFGAVLPLVDMTKRHTDDSQIHLMVADLHTLTTPTDFSKLAQQIWDNLKFYVAAGLPLDHENVQVFRQSYIAAHSELTWILDCFTGMGEMGRMTQFKDKSSKLSEDRISVGLFNYPVLMASDYLLYGASYVPVGDDQMQHLEFGRDIATRMNNQFGELFVVPKPVAEQHTFFGKEQGLRIKDLRDPTKKMSKSDEQGSGVVFLGDTPEIATRKIMSATTDSAGVVHYDPEAQPGISNLLQIMALLSGQPLQTVAEHWDGTTSYGDLKTAVAHETATFLKEFQTALAGVDEAMLKAKVEASERVMNDNANKRLHTIQQAVGLRP